MLQSRITSAHNKECHITSNKHNIILHLCNDDHVIHQKQSTSKPIALPHLSSNTICLILAVPNLLTLAELHWASMPSNAWSLTRGIHHLSPKSTTTAQKKGPSRKIEDYRKHGPHYNFFFNMIVKSCFCQMSKSTITRRETRLSPGLGNMFSMEILGQ